MAALAYQDLNVLANVYDSQDRKFDNVSTLDIGWSVSNEALATLSTTSGLLRAEPTADNLGYEKLTGGVQVVTPTAGASGDVDVTVTLKSSSSYFGSSVSDTLEISLVKDPQIDHQLDWFFNHPLNLESLRSGH